MQVTLYIPFANGDAVNGFTYDKPHELTPQKYVKMENKEYYSHKDGVDYMVTTNLGNNIAYNDYEKRKISVKNQTYSFHECDGNVRGFDGKDITNKELEDLWRKEQQFGLIVYLNEKEFSTKPDLETDLKMWIQDSQKIMKIDSLSDEEKIFHLPKKDFKIDFNKKQSHAILKNCKFGKLMSSVLKSNGQPSITSFGMIIERIIFVKK